MTWVRHALGVAGMPLALIPLAEEVCLWRYQTRVQAQWTISLLAMRSSAVRHLHGRDSERGLVRVAYVSVSSLYGGCGTRMGH
jgi:hypothetical protein